MVGGSLWVEHKKNSLKMKLEIQVLDWGRYKNVARLNCLMGSNSPLLDI
jgi:hypothetical protein